MTRLSLAHCKQIKQENQINQGIEWITNTQVKLRRWGHYIINLKSFANADSDESLGAQSLDGERNRTRYVPYRSKRFEDSHLRGYCFEQEIRVCRENNLGLSSGARRRWKKGFDELERENAAQEQWRRYNKQSHRKGLGFNQVQISLCPNFNFYFQ